MVKGFGDCEGAFNNCLGLDIDSLEAVPMILNVLLLDVIDKRDYRLDPAWPRIDGGFELVIVLPYV